MRTLKLRSEEVEIEGADGKPRRFTVRELDGQGRAVFAEHAISQTKQGADGQLVSNQARLELVLLSLTMHDESKNLVPLETLERWPGQVVKALASRAEALSEVQDQGNV